VKPSRVSFSLLLPLLELVIWVLLVPIPTTLFYLGTRTSTQPSGDVVISTKSGTYTVPQAAMRRIALEGPATRASHLLAALNIPGTIVEALLSLPTSWPHLWRPADLPMNVWRAITLPFFCLPAWWFVGRGFDSVQARQVRWPVALIGTILFIGVVVLFCGLRFGLSGDDRMDDSWPLWGMGLWALLFSVFPLAWLMRRRIPVSE
jgi:hypothetical protein